MENRANLLATSGNYHLVQIAGRAYPAFAIQGDSLKILHEAVIELSGYASTAGEDAEFALREISETVGGMVAAFEEMSRSAGKGLPYS